MACCVPSRTSLLSIREELNKIVQEPETTSSEVVVSLGDCSDLDGSDSKANNTQKAKVAARLLDLCDYLESRNWTLLQERWRRGEKSYSLFAETTPQLDSIRVQVLKQVTDSARNLFLEFHNSATAFDILWYAETWLSRILERGTTAHTEPLRLELGRIFFYLVLVSPSKGSEVAHDVVKRASEYFAMTTLNSSHGKRLQGNFEWQKGRCDPRRWERVPDLAIEMYLAAGMEFDSVMLRLDWARGEAELLRCLAPDALEPSVLKSAVIRSLENFHDVLSKQDVKLDESFLWPFLRVAVLDIAFGWHSRDKTAIVLRNLASHRSRQLAKVIDDCRVFAESASANRPAPIDRLLLLMDSALFEECAGIIPIRRVLADLASLDHWDCFQYSEKCGDVVETWWAVFGMNRKDAVVEVADNGWLPLLLPALESTVIWKRYAAFICPAVANARSPFSRPLFADCSAGGPAGFLPSTSLMTSVLKLDPLSRLRFADASVTCYVEDGTAVVGIEYFDVGVRYEMEKLLTHCKAELGVDKFKAFFGLQIEISDADPFANFVELQSATAVSDEECRILTADSDTGFSVSLHGNCCSGGRDSPGSPSAPQPSAGAVALPPKPFVVETCLYLGNDAVLSGVRGVAADLMTLKDVLHLLVPRHLFHNHMTAEDHQKLLAQVNNSNSETAALELGRHTNGCTVMYPNLKTAGSTDSGLVEEDIGQVEKERCVFNCSSEEGSVDAILVAVKCTQKEELIHWFSGQSNPQSGSSAAKFELCSVSSAIARGKYSGETLVTIHFGQLTEFWILSDDPNPRPVHGDSGNVWHLTDGNARSAFHLGLLNREKTIAAFPTVSKPPAKLRFMHMMARSMPPDAWLAKVYDLPSLLSFLQNEHVDIEEV